MSWVRAIWQEKFQEEEGVIPASWVIGKVVHWPTVTNAEKAMKEGRRPDDGKSMWSTYPLIKEKIKSSMSSLSSGKGHRNNVQS